MLQIRTTNKVMTKIVTVPALELPARIRAIHAGGGTVLSMAVERGNYSLTVRWNEPELVSTNTTDTQCLTGCFCDICASQDVGTSEGCDVPTQSVVVSITESPVPGENRRKLLAKPPNPDRRPFVVPPLVGVQPLFAYETKNKDR